VVREIVNYPAMSASHKFQCDVGPAGAISNPQQGNSSSWCSEEQPYIEVDPAALARCGASNDPVTGGDDKRYMTATSCSGNPPSSTGQLRYEPLNANTIDRGAVRGLYANLKPENRLVEIQQHTNNGDGSDVTAENKVVETKMKPVINLSVSNNSDYLIPSVQLQLQQQNDKDGVGDKMKDAAAVLLTTRKIKPTTRVRPIYAKPRKP
jgi:hypothetical protein